VIGFSIGGSTKRTEAFLEKLRRGDIYANLDAQARRGVVALSAATPRDSGLASKSWTYEIKRSATSCTITWNNTDVESGFPVAIMLQYGYGTGTGGYVQGQDYINPAMRPIFDQIADQVWKAVTSG
jgi:hypothetical protein